MDANGDGIGDLNGIIEKLDYLASLGIDVIWLSPIYDSPNDDNGYDIRDYYSIMKEFGTMAEFDRLLEEAHSRGLKIIMDLVVNHTSDEHEWFKQSRSSKDNLYRDYYIWKPAVSGKEPNNWGSIFSGPAWEYDETTDEYYLHLFSKKQPDLNWENKHLRQDIYKMMRFWLDKGIDGFRMDVINFISKAPGLPDGPTYGGLYGDGSAFFMNGPKIHEYLKEMNDEALAGYNVLTVGEMPGASPEDAILYTDPANKELNMIFTFEHMDLDSGAGGKWDVKPLHLPDLKANLAKWQTSLNERGWNSLYWNNHDQPRIVSRFGNDTKYRTLSAKMLATCLHMMKGTPYIYQGEEIGMTNVQFPSIQQYKDVETLNMYHEKTGLGVEKETILNSIYKKGRDNARTPMQWDDCEHAGFTTGSPWIDVNSRYPEINVQNTLAEDSSIFTHYQQLISLRKTLEIITNGTFKLLLSDHPSIFAYERIDKNEKLLVLCNFSEEQQQVEDDYVIAAIEKGKLLISNYSSQTKQTLHPYESSVYTVS